MRKTLSKRITVICAAALIMGLLAGCGGNASADTAAETAGQTVQTEQATETAGADERETAVAPETPETTVSTEAAETPQAAAGTSPAAETPQAASEEGDIFSGGYYDANSGRAFMFITPNDEGTFLVEITWSGSYNSSYVWAFNAERDGNVLTYTRGAKSLVIYDENGEYDADENGNMTPLIERDDLQGSFTLQDGVITWDDQTEHAGDDCSFVRDYNYSHIEITR